MPVTLVKMPTSPTPKVPKLRKEPVAYAEQMKAGLAQMSGPDKVYVLTLAEHWGCTEKAVLSVLVREHQLRNLAPKPEGLTSRKPPARAKKD
jgi:hypothetical protein